MGMPNGTHQAASNGIAALGRQISLHTSAAGTTGAFEATGGGYGRQETSGWTENGSGTNAGGQVNIPCAAATYVEGGIWSTETGTTLSEPENLAVTGDTVGGTFAAGTYYWVVTAVNHNGETTAGDEDSAVLTGSTGSADLVWDEVEGALSYKIYRGTSPGSENILVAEGVTGLTYTDTNAPGTSETPPVSNTASSFVGSAAFSGGSITVSGSGASINVTPSVAA
jgi:hypothetical protein